MALAASALFAAREAITSARADAGVTGYFDLDAPLTVERVQQACATPDDAFVL
jgi:xanthine dehydrogenase/oxidase